MIMVDHGNGWQTLYAHLNQIYVRCGQQIYQGATIGAVGSTGHSTGPHLHFETRLNGDLPNPRLYLPKP
jgi:murein DD-endopeptidase MepM/ murein hydrolase activator NlpD